jgi:20S proteasome subunit beta 2
MAGIFNDLGSGSNVDITVLTKDGAQVLRNLHKPNERPPKEQEYIYPRGTTGMFTS